MEEIPIGEARADLAEVVNRVSYSAARVVLMRRHKPVAAIVSMEDLEFLEQHRPTRIDLTSTGPGAPSAPGPVPGEPQRIAAQYRPPGEPPRRPGFRG